MNLEMITSTYFHSPGESSGGDGGFKVEMVFWSGLILLSGNGGERVGDR
jgi:hypothetical protein